MSRLPPVLVLDLDGTLVDTAGDLVATLNVVVAAEGLAPVPFAEARAMVGNGARAMLASALKTAGLNPEAERLDNLTAAFLAHYADHIADTSQPFPGAREALDRFQAAGWRLAICTNKIESMARLLLAKLELADRFVTIAGQDTYGVRKPDPRHLTETIGTAGGVPAGAIMVGDSGIDAATARAAGVPFVFVTFGYGPAPDHAPDRTIDRFADLFAAATALHRQGSKWWARQGLNL